MSALTQEKARKSAQWTYKEFTLPSGKAWRGGHACLNASGQVVPASSASALLSIGTFYETVDASAAAAAVTVRLWEEISLEYFANDGTSPVASTDVGALCYALDDQTVTISPTGRSPVGRVWEVNSVKGVAVQALQFPNATRADAKIGTLPGQVSNDFILPAANVFDGAIYDIGTQAAASTVTLPAAAPSGTKIYFEADGTKNGFTTTYRDATGTVNLTTALVASKRHFVICAKVGTAWYANAYVSP